MNGAISVLLGQSNTVFHLSFSSANVIYEIQVNVMISRAILRRVMEILKPHWKPNILNNSGNYKNVYS